MLTQEQIVTAHRANLETSLGLTNKVFEGAEKLVELSLQVAKTTLAESVEHTKKVLAAKDAQELLSVQTAVMQPLAEKVLIYGRHLYEIASGTQTEFNKVTEAQVAENGRKLQALVDNMSKNTSAGPESAVALMESALLIANNVYDSMQKTTKQAVELAESNFHAAVNAASKAAAQASAQARAVTDKKSTTTAV